MAKRPLHTLPKLRALAVTRSLFAATDLATAVERLGFVQADPIRAPARAQDLILRHRVQDYRVGDLERRYAELPIEEDVLHNYGFLWRAHQSLIHPRRLKGKLRVEQQAPRLARVVLDFVAKNGPTHPKMLEASFGKTAHKNYWGGQSNLTTAMLDALHYRGRLRIAQRRNGVRVYELARHLEPVFAQPVAPAVQALGLIDLLLRIHAPLPAASLRYVLTMLGRCVPQLRVLLGNAKTLEHLLEQASVQRAHVDGLDYVLRADDAADTGGEPTRVCLLAPFDPVVWDRRRFEHLWGWAYRFEAYTPPAKRQLGYYALPLLWRDHVHRLGHGVTHRGWRSRRAARVRAAASQGAALRPRARRGARPRAGVSRRDADQRSRELNSRSSPPARRLHACIATCPRYLDKARCGGAAAIASRPVEVRDGRAAL